MTCSFVITFSRLPSVLSCSSNGFSCDLFGSTASFHGSVVWKGSISAVFFISTSSSFSCCLPCCCVRPYSYFLAVFVSTGGSASRCRPCRIYFLLPSFSLLLDCARCCRLRPDCATCSCLIVLLPPLGFFSTWSFFLCPSCCSFRRSLLRLRVRLSPGAKA